MRIRSAGFGARKTLEDFDFDAQPAIRNQVASLIFGGFLTEARNVVLLALPAPARPTWRSRSARASLPATATGSCSPPPPTGSPGSPTPTAPGSSQPNWPLRRYGLIIIDEVGYLPFEQDAANLFFFQLVSSRYEHASLVLTSNLPFSGWGGVFGDQVVAAAMIDRIVHHADVLTLKGASYRLRNKGIDTLPSIRTTTNDTQG